MSFGDDALLPDGNPYTRLLVASLHGRALSETFTWRRALFGTYDVFHLHWPEHLVTHKGRVSHLRAVLLVLLTMRLQLSKTPVIRTVHNLTPHATLDPLALATVRLLERRAKRDIHMTAATRSKSASTVPSELIPHGHYRAEIDPSINPTPATPTELLYFGPIHDYKGVDELVRIFRTSPIEGNLRIQGRVMSDRLDLHEIAGDDARISLHLEHLGSAELQTLVMKSTAVVLPYRKLDNSGAALYALSLNKPILVPETSATLLLQREFGPEWVVTWQGALTPGKLTAAWKLVNRSIRSASVNMSTRDWETIGRRTAEIYTDAARSKDLRRRPIAFTFTSLSIRALSAFSRGARRASLPKRVQRVLNNARHALTLCYLRRFFGSTVQRAPAAPAKRESPTRIWSFWRQGWRLAPQVARLGSASLSNHANAPVVQIDRRTLPSIVKVDARVERWMREGRLSEAHYSDLIRVSLLRQHGGIWIDPTVVAASPIDFTEVDGLISLVRPASPVAENISNQRWSTFLLGSRGNHWIWAELERRLLAYWAHHRTAIHYHLLDYLISMLVDDHDLTFSAPASSTSLYDLDIAMRAANDANVVRSALQKSSISKLSLRGNYSAIALTTLSSEVGI
ncbi:capsular polysaccharide synthesis protein [Microbacterium thalli]|uniref:Capsular polysaccharide synthesis protein n=1 Tax=Microbacterium thalli TaxID=3027921 RepID=A0ABT5SKY9_9MICO|nr:capsular polysaccharide synthesis protein [Microbacterium thalli]MDD7963506.1 capsular polysaccharide synthesis protein [Microbacterium thalli]